MGHLASGLRPGGFDMRLIRLTTVLLALGLVAAGCGSEATRGGQIVVGICEPDDLVPQNDLEICGSQVINNLFSGLVRYDDESGAPENLMATSIESDDQKVWTIEIEDGWTFHDGEPVTAKSYVDAWNFGAKPVNENSYYFAQIQGYDAVAPAEGRPTATTMSGLKVIDNTSFEVTLSAPFSQFPTTLGFQAFFPLPSNATKNIKAFREAPVGNGPYKMVGTWAHDDNITVEAYEDYPAGRSGPEEVEFRIYQESTAMYRELQAGNIDLAIELSEDLTRQARKDFPDGVLEVEGTSISYLGFPTNAPYNNVEFRRAISLAINRKAIIDKILFGNRTVAGSFVPTAIAGSRNNACDFCRHDPAEAKRRHEAAGSPKAVKLWYTTDDPTGQQVAEAVGNQLRTTLGITPTYRGMLFSEFIEVQQAGEVDGPYFLGWFADYPSPQNFLEPLFSTNGSANDVKYSNKEFDDLVTKGNEAEDVDSGIEFYQQAEDIVLDQLPGTPLWYGILQNAHGERLTKATFRVGVLDLTGVTVAA